MEERGVLACELICCKPGIQSHVLVVLGTLVPASTKSMISFHVYHVRVSVIQGRQSYSITILLQSLEQALPHPAFSQDCLLRGRQLVARHYRRGAAKNAAWAVNKTGFRCPHWLLSLLCLSQHVPGRRLFARSHSLCCSFCLGLKWQQ